MKRVLRTVTFAVLIAAGTVAAGWWTVPVIAALWTRVLPFDRRPVGTAIFGAAAGWATLVAVAWLHGHVPALALTLSAALGLPPWGFLAATFLFPALLGGAAALLVKPPPIA